MVVVVVVLWVEIVEIAVPFVTELELFIDVLAVLLIAWLLVVVLLIYELDT